MDTCKQRCKHQCKQPPHMETRKKPNIYDEIIPPHQKIVMEGAEKYLIHLPGFFKEQLNVEFSTDGKITVSGQRPLFDNWWSRFRKELQAPENYNINNMHVSFKDEVLCIVLPNFTNKAKATVKDEPTHDASKKEGATSTLEPKCSCRKQQEQNKCEMSDATHVEEKKVKDHLIETKNAEKVTGKDQPEQGKKGIDAAALATCHGAGIRLRKMKLKMGRLEDELSNTRKLMGAFIVATVVSVGVGLYFHCSPTSTET
ncbi:inactive protein RESTRICTED TEV MOVEMENT 2-like [Musa acuminata AAA Group]|uniref:inactive protein RESTRICTED TEV MOVEMENT 2-like n=1 Tax=Musa acuminata AAA Group TaxID=214697 RepID=UPI0031D57898